jgi:mersacidin/lichenicidin family type 2 lantibiotic
MLATKDKAQERQSNQDLKGGSVISENPSVTALSTEQIIMAWKSPEYRRQLSPEQLAVLPEHPAQLIRANIIPQPVLETEGTDSIPNEYCTWADWCTTSDSTAYSPCYTWDWDPCDDSGTWSFRCNNDTLYAVDTCFSPCW